MNKQRRKAVMAILAKLPEIKDEIERLRDEEQEALDSLPEALQDSDRGSAMQDAIGFLESALEYTEQLESELESAADGTAAL